MKKFDLEAAKRGAKVCTRDGNPAKILCFNKEDDVYPIAALYEYEGIERFISHTLDGRYHYLHEDGNDLMMADDDYEEKLERGEYGPTPASATDVPTPAPASADPTPAPAPDPWDAFKREAAMELLRQRNGFVGRDIVEWVTSDVNRLVEGLKGKKE